jgi:urease accessory protein
MSTPPADGGWPALLNLGYAYVNGKSVLVQQERCGPLFVQKPFYPEGPQTCHTYIIHPPGGVVGADRLDLGVTVGRRGHALITTPAATKFYRSAGPRATQTTRLHAAADAVLEWLPQETIIYDGAHVGMRTIVHLEAGAQFIGWEMICLGLPACGLPFSQGGIHQHLEVWQEEKPYLIERLRIFPQDPLRAAPWGLGGRPVIGTLVVTAQQTALVDALRQQLPPKDAGGLFAVTRIQGLIVCRYSGHDVYAGLKLFGRAWEVLRPAVTGRKACPPRIWAT